MKGQVWNLKATKKRWPLVSKEGINQKYHRASSDVRFWTSQHAFSSFALLTQKKFGMLLSISVWKRWGFLCHKLFRTRFCCTSTRALSFGLIYLQTMRQACCWQADMFGVTCHPVLLQLLIYHHDVLLSVSSKSNTVYLICFLCVFVNQSVLPPFSYSIPKRKKVAEFPTLGISHPSSIWSLSPKAVVPQHLRKMVGRSKGGFASPQKKDTVPLKFTIASEYYCSYLVSFWGVLPMFRGKLLFLSFSMFQCTRKWQLTWDTQTLFVSAAPFFFLAMGAAWKNPLKEAVNSVGEVKWRVSKLEIKTVAFSSKRPEWAHATTRWTTIQAPKKWPTKLWTLPPSQWNLSS